MNNILNYIQTNTSDILVLAASIALFYFSLKALTGDLSRKKQYRESVLRGQEKAQTIDSDGIAHLKKVRSTRTFINLATLAFILTLPITTKYILIFTDTYGLLILDYWPLLFFLLIALGVLRMFFGIIKLKLISTKLKNARAKQQPPKE